MKSRHGRISIYAAAALIFFSFLLFSCQNLVIKEPSFTLRKIGVSHRSLNDMGIMLHIDVLNPNPFDIRLQSFEYTIYLNKEEFGKGNLEKSIMAAASATTPLEVPVSVKFVNLLGGLMAVISAPDLPYKIEGKAGVATSFGALDYKFSQEGKMLQK